MTARVMPVNEVYRFGEFTLDVGERRLRRGATPVPLWDKSLDVLTVLVRAAGRLVTKQRLLAEVWPDAFVEAGILTVHVSAIRKALADGRLRRGWIETVPRSGYRFADGVVRLSSTAATDARPRVAASVHQRVAAGRAHFLTGSSEEMAAALSSFRAALRLDPACASAHAGLALTHCAQARLRLVPHAEAYEGAKAAALRALAMDHESADAQTALGTVLFLSEWDWPAAARSLRRALATSPDHIEALLQYGALHDVFGDFAQGLQLKRRALDGAPRSPLVLMEIAVSNSLQRNFAEAIAGARKALAIDPRNRRATEFITLTHLLTGEIDGVVAERRRRAVAFGLDSTDRVALEQRLAAFIQAYAQGGLAEVAHLLLSTFATGDDSRACLQRARLFATLGNLDAAFEQLERALAERDPSLVYLAVDPLWDGLRADPRMDHLLSRIGLCKPAGLDLPHARGHV